MEEKRKYSFIEWLCAVIVGAQFVIVCAAVISRYVFRNALMWTDEAAKFLLIYITFFGAVLGETKGQNIRFDFLTSKFPPMLKICNRILIAAIAVAFYIVAIIYGIRISIETGWMQAVTIPWIKWTYVYICNPVSFLMLMYMEIRNCIKDVRQANAERNVEQKEGKE